jgi:hypothetical protein
MSSKIHSKGVIFEAYNSKEIVLKRVEYDGEL